MPKFKDYIKEDYEWLSNPKREFIKNIENTNKFKIDVNKNSKTIKIYRDNKKTKQITQGLEIFSDGTAIDMTVRVDAAKVMSSIKDWEKVMK